MQCRARVQRNPIKSATTVLSEEQRPERRSERVNERRGKKQRIKIKQPDESGVSQRSIHSSKVTDPHPRLLLRAKCSTEKPDELQSWGRIGERRRTRRRTGTSAPTSFYFPPQQLSTFEREYRSMSCHPHSTHLRRSKILISQQNWDFSNTVAKWHISL